MKVEITPHGALNIYVPHYGWLSQCYEQLWGAGKHADGPLRHETIYPALQDMRMEGFRLELWEEILNSRFI